MLDQGSQVHETYLNTKKSITDSQGERLYLREASEYTDRAIYGDLNSEEAKQINEQLYNDWKTSLDAGQSWAIEYDIMGQMSLVDGVQNVTMINIFNKSGGDYSINQYDMDSAEPKNDLGEKGGIIYPSVDPMIFEVKYPNTDITGRAR